MKKHILIGIVIIVAVLVYVYSGDSEAKKAAIKEANFTDSMEYACTDGKKIGVAFASDVVRISLSDKRVFTLERVSTDDSGTKFSNEESKINFWMKDEGAFVEENGTTTYAGCMFSA
jgi:hypothetical protein